MARAKKSEAEKTEKKSADVVKETAKTKKADEIAALQAENEAMKAQIAQLMEMVKEAQNAEKAESKEQSDLVTVLFMAEVSPKNVLEIPGYGALSPNSYLDVPKKEFGGKFMSPLVRKLIDRRHLIIMDGLTKDERVRWNCDYKEGEVLSEKAFDHLLDIDLDKLKQIFPMLCEEHQRFVCRRFITAKEHGDNRVSLAKAQAINEMSKVNDENGMLWPVIEAFKAEI